MDNKEEIDCFVAKRKKTKLSQLDLSKAIGYKSLLPIQAIEKGRGTIQNYINANRVLNRKIEAIEEQRLKEVLEVVNCPKLNVVDNMAKLGTISVTSDFVYFDIHHSSIPTPMFFWSQKGLVVKDQEQHDKESKEVARVAKALNGIYL